MKPIVILLALCRIAMAQVSPSGVTDQTLTGQFSTSSPLGVRVATGGGLSTGGGVGGLKLDTTGCTATQVLAWNGSAWACTSNGVTSVVAGTGISVSGTTTATITANLAGASCAAGSYMSALGATGTGTCTVASGVISGLTSGKVPVANSPTSVIDGSWSDTGSVLSTTSTVDLMGGVRDGVSYATLAAGVTTDWNPFGAGAATPIVVVTVNSSDSTIDSIDASKFAPLCLSNKAPKLRIMHDATNHGTLFITNREGSVSTHADYKIDLPSNMPVTVAMPHRGVIDLEYQCPLNVWKVVGNQEAQMGGSYGYVSSITDTTLGALVTDYNPTGFDTTAELRLGPTGASSTIASMVARSDTGGRIQFVKCITALGTIIIQDTTHSAGTAQYRFLLPGNADLTIPAYATACFRYDAAQTYWMLQTGPGTLLTGGTISGLTTNTLPIATSATTLGNSHITESSGAVRIGSTLMVVDYTTGAATMNNSLAVVGASGTNTITPTNTAAGQTVTNALVSAVKLGSFNTTAGSLFSYAGLFEAQSSKSAGANTLFNVGGWFDARNGDANYAIYADAGNVQLNASGGTTTVGGALTAQSTLAVTGAATLSSTLAVTSTATADGGKRIVDDVATGGGLVQVGNTLGLLTSCSATNVLAWSGTAWACAAAGGGGSGTVTSITCGTGLSCTAANPIVASGTITANLAGASCGAGQHVSAISATGTGTCTADSGGTPSVISPAQLVANTNDWAPAGIGTATTVNVDTSNTWQITGISAGTDGRKLTLHNIGANSFYLITASASSAAANRFSGGSGAYLVQSGADVMLEYRGSTSRWVVEFVGGQFVYDLYVLNSATFGVASATFTGAATIASTLGVTGATTLSSTLGVTSLATFNGGVSVPSAGRLEFTGEARDDGTLITCTSGCTVASFAGATSGTVTATSTSMTTTFGLTFSHTPTCVTSTQGTTKGYGYTVSTTAISWTSITNTAVYDFICWGH